MKQSIILPRIRLTKIKGKGRAIIPVAAISGIEEDKLEKCTRVCTFDGFWYEVSNPIEEVDAKIEEAEYGISEKSAQGKPSLPNSRAQEQLSPQRKIIKKTASAAVDKPPRRIAEITRTEAQVKKEQPCE